MATSKTNRVSVYGRPNSQGPRVSVLSSAEEIMPAQHVPVPRPRPCFSSTSSSSSVLSPAGGLCFCSLLLWAGRGPFCLWLCVWTALEGELPADGLWAERAWAILYVDHARTFCRHLFLYIKARSKSGSRFVHVNPLFDSRMINIIRSRIGFLSHTGSLRYGKSGTFWMGSFLSHRSLPRGTSGPASTTAVLDF